MKSIQVYDPALCCSTGVCGVDVSQALVTFSADAEWAKQQGTRIERFNLAQQPMAFAENAVVKNLLENAGQDALPVTLVDGKLVLAGRYPSRADLARWNGLALQADEEKKSGGCCTPAPQSQSHESSDCGCAPTPQSQPKAQTGCGCASSESKSKCC